MIYESTTSAKSWYFLANSIFLLKNLRKEEFESKDNVRSINTTIILNVSATVEGAITSHFERNFKSHPTYKESARKNAFLTKDVFDLVFSNLESSGFERKIDLYNQFLLVNLKELPECKTVKALTQFRNVLSHGGTFRHMKKRVDDWTGEDYQNIEERNEIVPTSTSWTKQALIMFLKEKGLIEFNDSKEWKVIFEASLFNSNVADYFIESAKTFILEVFKTPNLSSDLLENHIAQHLGEARPPFPKESMKAQINIVKGRS